MESSCPQWYCFHQQQGGGGGAHCPVNKSRVSRVALIAGHLVDAPKKNTQNLFLLRNAKQERKAKFWMQECKPWKINLGMRTLEQEPWNPNLGTWASECDPWNANLGTQTLGHKPWNVNLGTRTLECEPWNTNIGTWTLEHEHWNVNLGTRRKKLSFGTRNAKSISRNAGK